MASDEIKKALTESGLRFNLNADKETAEPEPIGFCPLFCKEGCWLGCYNLCDSHACLGNTCIGYCALQCRIECVQVDRQ
jgi:hypothetical protein